RDGHGVRGARQGGPRPRLGKGRRGDRAASRPPGRPGVPAVGARRGEERPLRRFRREPRGEGRDPVPDPRRLLHGADREALLDRRADGGTARAERTDGNDELNRPETMSRVGKIGSERVTSVDRAKAVPRPAKAGAANVEAPGSQHASRADASPYSYRAHARKV